MREMASKVDRLADAALRHHPGCGVERALRMVFVGDWRPKDCKYAVTGALHDVVVMTKLRARGHERFSSGEKFSETASAGFNRQLSRVLQIAQNPRNRGDFAQRARESA
jgi:hypothetical protein